MQVPRPARMTLERWRRLLPGPWLGCLLCVALLGTPAAFALLERSLATRVALRMLAGEAYASLALGIVLLVLERLAARRGAAAGGSQFTPGMVLALGALFCTVAGYFALAPMMEAARAGQGRFGFAQLHAASVALYGLKTVLVLALAWRAARPAATTASS